MCFLDRFQLSGNGSVYQELVDAQTIWIAQLNRRKLERII
jgi:hypothetical protein